jgi:hypothetical protein
MIVSILMVSMLLLSCGPVQEANAGPISYAACVANCYASSALLPPLIPLCVAACFPLLASPTP